MNWWLTSAMIAAVSMLLLAACSNGGSSGDAGDGLVRTDVVDDTGSNSDSPAGDVYDADTAAQAPSRPLELPLESWKIRRSSLAKADGGEISKPGYDDGSWTEARCPGTVMGAQVDAGELGDVMYGDNLTRVPGYTLNFLPKPPGSPYGEGWWWRTEFDAPGPTAPIYAVLHFEGINYRANIWVNGQKVAGSDEVVGAFREYFFDVSEVAVLGGRNAVAVEVFSPEPYSDLAVHWVDWNPDPPDRNMGLWMPARFRLHGPVSISNPAVLPDLSEDGGADLTFVADLTNYAQEPATAVVRLQFDGRDFSHEVSLDPGETKELFVTPKEHPELRVADPELWWPYSYGDPHLYDMKIDVAVDGITSDIDEIKFGIREVEAELTQDDVLKYSINGKPILIRGGGWAPDMFYRFDPVRDRWELEYVRDMGLNTIRMEGKFEDHGFYDMADELGVLLMPGWCCCDMWEKWATWNDTTRLVAVASLESQLKRFRRHASVFTWFNGSDFHPPADVEQAYLAKAEEVHWNLPIVSNATEDPSDVTGLSGVKMTGPYQWVPPNYWYLAVPQDPLALNGQNEWEWMYGGAFGFNTESSPGPAIPPLDSLVRMMDLEDLWPMGQVVWLHSGNDAQQRLGYFTEGMDARLGPPVDLEDLAFKSQVLAYESHRAMFEAQARNKYFSTGFIQWMLNNAWPGMIWHLYDYYLRPGGSYYGSKSAMRPIHIQLSYDDLSVWLINSTLKDYDSLKVQIRVIDMDSQVVHTEHVSDVAIGADGAIEVASVADWVASHADELGQVYFVDLRLLSVESQQLDRSFYWMPTQQDTYGWKSNEANHPDATLASMTELSTLPDVDLKTSNWKVTTTGDFADITFTLTNPSDVLAFFVEVRLVTPEGATILPILWNDNYVSLLPKESNDFHAHVPAKAIANAQPKLLVIEGNRGK